MVANKGRGGHLELQHRVASGPADNAEHSESQTTTPIRTGHLRARTHLTNRADALGSARAKHRCAPTRRLAKEQVAKREPSLPGAQRQPGGALHGTWKTIVGRLFATPSHS
jgi:hypothetical protein